MDIHYFHGRVYRRARRTVLTEVKGVQEFLKNRSVIANLEDEIGDILIVCDVLISETKSIHPMQKCLKLISTR